MTGKTAPRQQHAGPGAARPAHGSEHACARAWSALNAAHARIAAQLGTALARNCGLTIHEFEILLRLDQAQAPGLRIGELTCAVPLTQPSLSRAVARLERRGLLSRAGTAADRRGVVVTITPAGRDVLGAAALVHAQTIRQFLLGPLTAGEQELIGRALTRVAES